MTFTSSLFFRGSVHENGKNPVCCSDCIIDNSAALGMYFMELKVNKDGSCEAAYIIDASQFDGFLTVDQIENHSSNQWKKPTPRPERLLQY